MNGNDPWYLVCMQMRRKDSLSAALWAHSVSVASKLTMTFIHLWRQTSSFFGTPTILHYTQSHNNPCDNQGSHPVQITAQISFCPSHQICAHFERTDLALGIVLFSWVDARRASDFTPLIPKVEDHDVLVLSIAFNNVKWQRIVATFNFSMSAKSTPPQISCNSFCFSTTFSPTFDQTYTTLICTL